MIDTNICAWDWIVICFYFIFVIGIGFLFKHVNKNASDFFRGGGNMLWWMAGMSAIAASLSTWSFTAASAKVYRTGFLWPFSSLLAGGISCIILWYLAPRFRQMRVVTSLEGVARRFGFGSEQFYVYLTLPMGLFWGGVGACGSAIFFSEALGIGVPQTLVAVVSIVTIMSMFGGQWAVAASDFVQGLLMFLTVLVVVYFSLGLPEIGGIGNLTNSLPERHFNFTENTHAEIVIAWLIVSQILTVFGTMNLNGEGARYLAVKDGKQARGMVMLRLVLFVVIPVVMIMQIPAICAATVFPDMEAIFPNMKVPEEGAFLAMAFKTLPQGMMGLLICGMFAAAMSSMDSSLNFNAGYFVRNIYIKYINRNASGKRQLMMGRVFTLIFGAIIIIIGLSFHSSREMDLFNVFQILNAMIWLPSLVPTSLGMIYKRTPGWSGWSTVLVGLVTGAIAKFIYSNEGMQAILGIASETTKAEKADMEFIFITLIVLVATVGWFFFSSLFYNKTKEEYKEQVNLFFIDIKTPIDHKKEDVRNQDAMQYRLVGIMCIIFGGFATLGMLIPNPLSGRLCFLFVGGIILTLGIVLFSISVKKLKDDPNAEL
ncbi:MAG: hypothetical protein JXR78_18790 [Victivallales bacterium]|nr:hypothetical protein [Victivallales bacterium]